MPDFNGGLKQSLVEKISANNYIPKIYVDVFTKLITTDVEGMDWWIHPDENMVVITHPYQISAYNSMCLGLN